MAADTKNEAIVKLLRSVYKADKRLVDIKGRGPSGRPSDANGDDQTKVWDARNLGFWLSVS
jgi:hypothetical protein